ALFYGLASRLPGSATREALHRGLAGMAEADPQVVPLRVELLPVEPLLEGLPGRTVVVHRQAIAQLELARHRGTHCLEVVVLPVLARSEEHTSELQSRFDLVCRLLLDDTSTSSLYTLSLHDALPIWYGRG